MKHPLLQYQILCAVDESRMPGARPPAEYVPAARAVTREETECTALFHCGNGRLDSRGDLRDFRGCYRIAAGIVHCRYSIACHGDAALRLLMPRFVIHHQQVRSPGARLTDSSCTAWLLYRIRRRAGTMAKLRDDIDPLLCRYERDGKTRDLAADPDYFQLDHIAIVVPAGYLERFKGWKSL